MPVVVPNSHGLVTQEFFSLGIAKALAITYGVENLDVGQDADQIAAGLRAIFHSSVWNVSPRGPTWSLGPCRIQYRTAGGALVGGEDGQITVGTSGATPSPPVNCAILVKKVTGSSGRQNRGRMFLPPFLLAEGNVDNNGLLDVSVRSGFQTLMSAWLADLNTGEFAMKIMHQTALDPTLVIGLSVDSRLATQRRRMR